MNKIQKKIYKKVLRLCLVAEKIVITKKIYNSEKLQKKLEQKNKTASIRLYKKTFLLAKELALSFENSENILLKNSMFSLAKSIAGKAGLIEEVKQFEKNY